MTGKGGDTQPTTHDQVPGTVRLPETTRSREHKPGGPEQHIGATTASPNADYGRVIWNRETMHGPSVVPANADRARTCPRVVGASADGKRMIVCGQPVPCPEHAPPNADSGRVITRATVDVWLVRVMGAPVRCALCDKPILTIWEGNVLALLEHIRDHAAVCEGDEAELFRTAFPPHNGRYGTP